MYGESVDKIVSSNTAIFTYLISNDTDMLEELSKQAGNTHVTRAASKNVTKNNGIFKSTINDEVSYTYQTQEEPLFTVDKLMSFTNGESMVLSTVHRADNSGEAVRPNPIYNTKATLLPMAWALHRDGHNSDLFKTALQNMEVATSASDRDVYQTLPNFKLMYEKRFRQALLADKMQEKYLESEGLTEDDLINRNADEVSESVMAMIFAEMNNTDRNIEAEFDGEVTGHIEDDEDSDFNAVAFIEEAEGLDFESDLDTFEKSDETYADAVDFVRHEESYQGLPKNQREVLAQSTDLGEEDIANIVYARESQVPKDERAFQKGINSSQKVGAERQQAEKEKLYLDRTLSFADIRQGTRIGEILGQAIGDVEIAPADLAGNFQWKQQGNEFEIYYSPSNTLVASYTDEDTIGEINTNWYIHPAFINLLKQTAEPSGIDVTGQDSHKNIRQLYEMNAQNTDALFDIDSTGLVRRTFIDLFEKDTQL